LISQPGVQRDVIGLAGAGSYGVINYQCPGSRSPASPRIKSIDMLSWIKRGADLNRMIPALSAYLGQVGFGSADRYQSLTPPHSVRQIESEPGQKTMAR
jgi:hypothetical protein